MKKTIEWNLKIEKISYIIPTDLDHFYCQEYNKDIKSLTINYIANYKVQDKRSNSSLVIYYSIIVSANQVIKDVIV